MSLIATAFTASRAALLPPELVAACLHTAAPGLFDSKAGTTKVGSKAGTKPEESVPPPTTEREEPPHLGRASLGHNAPVRRPSHREEDLRRHGLSSSQRRRDDRVRMSYGVSSILSSVWASSRAALLRPDPVVACLHTTVPCFHYNTTKTAPSRTRLVKDLRPSSQHKSAKYEVAPKRDERRPERPETPPRKPKVVNPLSDELDLSARTVSTKELPSDFRSAPLIDGLLSSVHDVLGPNAQPTPIQALALKHLVSAEPPTQDSPYRQALLASETGSGKSIAYLLPLLQDLKQSEVHGTQRPGPESTPRRAMNPRALVLAPTHELSRQLSGFAKELLHHTKLRVLCASRANVTSRRNVSAAKMADALVEDEGGSLEPSAEFAVRPEGQGHPVDVVVGTPSKVLELMRGRGWDYETRAQEREERGEKERHGHRKVVVGEPQMSLANIEWVVVDEADVLFGASRPSFASSPPLTFSPLQTPISKNPLVASSTRSPLPADTLSHRPLFPYPGNRRPSTTRSTSSSPPPPSPPRSPPTSTRTTPR